MKTYVKMIALAFVLFHYACEPAQVGPPPRPSSNNTVVLDVNGRLTPTVETADDESMVIQWNGQADTKLAPHVYVSLSHKVYDFEEDESFLVSEGYFNLYTDDQTSSLSGFYTGYGKRMNGQMVTEGSVTIQSGTGVFATQGGTLYLSIDGFDPFEAVHTDSDIWIYGKLAVAAISNTTTQ